MKKSCLLSIVAMAGLAGSASAQDSISSAPGLPGDALQANRTGVPYQQSAYVVDMVRLYGSWGTRLGIAPIVKLSSYENAFRSAGSPVFNALPSASGISQTLRVDHQFPAGQYRLWENAPGQGVHPTANSATGVVSPQGGPSQFGAVVAEFGTDATGRSYNAIIGAAVDFDPANPSRLYVTRTNAAVNVPDPALGGDRSQFGAGACDALGNVTFRVDNFGVTGANPITGNNYFRVRTIPLNVFAGRDNSQINLIDNAGGSDVNATDWVVQRQAASHNTPNNIPAELTPNFRGRVLGSNFNTQYVYESSPLTTTTTTAHRPGTQDHRGGVTFSKHLLRGGATVGTAAMISKINTGSAQPSECISMWGIDGNGTPVNPVTISNLPRAAGAVVADPCASTTTGAYNWDLGTGDFRNYSSSVFSRGGNGQIAMAVDQGGSGLLAGFVSGAQSLNANSLPTDDSPHNGIAVYRFDLNNPNAGQWIMAAWTNPAGAFTNASGKEIYGDNGNDGVAFTSDPGEFDGVVDLDPLSPTYDAPIGTMTSMFEVTNGSIIGPSISSPAFDSVGNIYFVSAVRLYKANGFVDTDSALLRAVYDRANFCYRLELLMELGDTFVGANSGTRYQIQFLNIAASNSRPSPSTLWSNSVAGYAWNNTDPSTLDVTDPMALGGLVLSAGIIYDVNGDGNYERISANPATPDQQYSVLLYIGNMDAPQAPGCPADFNGDGFLDFFDYDDYVFCFETANCPPGKTADFNGDGFADFFDYDDFVAAFEIGC